ncbi:MAG: class I SAM-dependent methyltransferase [Rhodospirillaceae bacterium]|nr:MAG: class I SAM-dependent methyltransferase [Rhodospirillaceae bacterium]
MIMTSVLATVYHEIGAGGFPHNDQIMLFFLRVHALLTPDMTVMDFGAGRGRISEASSGFCRDFKILKGKCGKVIGADIDPIVRENQTVDESCVIDADGRIPLPDRSVDLVFSCATFEHIEKPAETARELSRVLRPGGWICAWTPAKWGYVAVGARLVPNAMHARAVRMLASGGRRTADVFPTFYRLNTIGAVQQHFMPLGFTDYSYYLGGAPSYFANRAALARFWAGYNSLMPPPLKKNLHVFLQKNG